LEQALSELQERILLQEAEKKTMETQLETAQTEIQQLKQEVLSLNNEVSSLETKLAAEVSLKESLARANECLTLQLSQAEEDKIQLLQQLALERDHAQTMNVELSDTQQQLSTLLAKYDHLEQDLLQRQQHIHQLQEHMHCLSKV
jgi:chromosome segregation ATPase